MRKRISRMAWPAAALTALSVVCTSFADAEAAKDAAAPEPPPKGILSADRTRVVVGETVHLRLTISGGEGLRKGTFEQPVLPSLAHLDLLAAGQRNELTFRSGAGGFSSAFFYTLKAKSPGVEKLPPIQVKYRVGEGGEGLTIPVNGLEITIGEGRRIGRRTIALVIFVIAGGAFFGVAWRMRAR